MGVHADGEARFRPELLESDRRSLFVAVAGFENDERGDDAGTFRSGDHRFEVGLECLVREMTMAIDH